MKPAPIKDTATIDDLDKIDIRVGEIVEVEDLPDSRKMAGVVSEGMLLDIGYPDGIDPVPNGARAG